MPAERGGAEACHDRRMTNSSDDNTEIGSGVKIRWADHVADHDDFAAEADLSLKLDEEALAKAIKRLRKPALTTRRANDILRSAGLTPAPLDDPGVIKDLIQAIEGTPLSPVLVLYAGRSPRTSPTVSIASLVYRIDPYAAVP